MFGPSRISIGISPYKTNAACRFGVSVWPKKKSRKRVARTCFLSPKPKQSTTRMQPGTAGKKRLVPAGALRKGNGDDRDQTSKGWARSD